MPFVQLSSKPANASKSGGQKETIPLQDICNTSGSSQRSPKHSVSLPMQTKMCWVFFVICRFILLVHDFVLMVVIDMSNNNKNKVLVEYIMQNSNQ